MPISQYSSAQSANGQYIADFGSTLPVNFSGQVIGGNSPSLFTVGGWIRFLENEYGGGTIFSVDQQFQLTATSSGAINAAFVGGGSVTSDIDITDSNWHFVACSYQQSSTQAATSGVLEIYIDGSQSAAADVSGSTNTGPADCQLGPNNNSLDAVSWCVWSIPLSSDVMDVPFWGPQGGLTDAGLVAAFDFGGGAAVDKGPNSYPISVSALTWHTACLQISNGYLTPSSADGLAPGGPSECSVVGWAQLSGGSLAGPLWSTGPTFNTQLGSGAVEVSWGGTQVLTAAATAGWNHVAVTYDGANGHLYVNGQQLASRAVTPDATTGSFTLGSDGMGNLAPGLNLQSVSVWTTALTGTQIIGLMLGDVPLGEAGCVGFFPFTDSTENEMGNLVTLNAPSVIQASVAVQDTPITAPTSNADSLDSRTTTAEATDSIDDAGPALLRFADLRRLAAAAQQASTTSTAPAPVLGNAISDTDVDEAVAWYEQFVTGLSPALAARLRAEFETNLRAGLALRASGSTAGTFDVRIENNQTVAYYSTESGEQEVGRVDAVLSPYLVWVVKIFIAIAGIIAAMFGILASAAKVTKAVGLLEGVYPAVGAAAAGAQGTGTAKVCDAIWKVIGVLWEWKAIGSLIWQLVTASWWTIAFTVASLVAQVVALVATGGWLIAVKVAQMSVAIGQLLDVLLNPPSATDTLPAT